VSGVLIWRVMGWHEPPKWVYAQVAEGKLAEAKLFETLRHIARVNRDDAYIRDSLQ